MGEFTYTKADLKNHKVFNIIKFTISDIIFLQNDQYVVLRLKRSMTDIQYTKVEIIIAATNNASCPISALCQLFMLDLQPNNTPLFKIDNRAAFAYKSVIPILHQKLETSNILYQTYSGHSFCKDVA